MRSIPALFILAQISIVFALPPYVEEAITILDTSYLLTSRFYPSASLADSAPEKKRLLLKVCALDSLNPPVDSGPYFIFYTIRKQGDIDTVLSFIDAYFKASAIPVDKKARLKLTNLKLHFRDVAGYAYLDLVLPRLYGNPLIRGLSSFSNAKIESQEVQGGSPNLGHALENYRELNSYIDTLLNKSQMTFSDSIMLHALIDTACSEVDSINNLRLKLTHTQLSIEFRPDSATLAKLERKPRPAGFTVAVGSIIVVFISTLVIYMYMQINTK